MFLERTRKPIIFKNNLTVSCIRKIFVLYLQPN
jgi:hypothetical protein